MENEGGYQGGGTGGGTCGCFAAAGFTWAVMMPFLFGWAWSGAHCEPAPQCRDEIGWWIAGQMTVILALAALLGFSVRAVVNWGMRVWEGAEPARPPYWAFAALLLLAALAGWIGWALYRP